MMESGILGASGYGEAIGINREITDTSGISNKINHDSPYYRKN